jgi:hypothetical protein
MQQSTDDHGIGIADIVRRAWADPAFKRSLLASPKVVIERTLGVTLPAEVKIYIHEETDTEIHLVLPKSSESLNASDISPDHSRTELPDV